VNPALLKNFFQKNVSVGWTVCRFHGARGGAPERNGNYRHGGRTKEMIEVWNTTVVVDNGLSLYNWIPVRANS